MLDPRRARRRVQASPSPDERVAPPNVRVECFCMQEQSSHALPADTTPPWSVLPCGHINHSACLHKWRQEQKKKSQPFSCPACRSITEVYTKVDNRRRIIPYTGLFFVATDKDPDAPPSSQPETQTQPWELVPPQEDPDETEDLSELQRVRKDLEESRRQRSEMAVTLRDVKEKRDADLKLKEAENDLLSQKLDDKDDQIEELTSTIANLRAGQPDLLKEVKELEEQRHAKDELIRELAEKIQEGEDLFQEERDEWTQTLGERDARIASLTSRIAQEGKGPANRIHELSEAVKDLRAKAKQQEKAHATALAAAEDKLRKLRNDLTECREAKNAAQSERDTVIKDKSAIERANLSYHGKLQAKKLKYDELKIKYDALVARRRGIQSSDDEQNGAENDARSPIRARPPLDPFRSPSPDSPRFTTVNRIAKASPSKPVSKPIDSSWSDDDIIIQDEATGLATSPGKKSEPFRSLLCGSSTSFGQSKRKLETHKSDRHLPSLGDGVVVDRGPKKKIKMGKK